MEERWRIGVEGGEVRDVVVKIRRPVLWLEKPGAPTHCAYAPGAPCSQAMGMGARDAVVRFALWRMWSITEILAPGELSRAEALAAASWEASGRAHVSSVAA